MSLDISPKLDDNHDLFEAVEEVLGDLGWQFDREGYDAVQCIAPTRWGEMGALFASRHEPAALHFSLTLDVKPQPARRAIISELVILMNERLWLGHFDYWIEDEVVIYRHALPLGGRMAPSIGEIKAVLSAATEAAEQFVPAFNFVIWAGKKPVEAMAAAMFETDGEA